MASVIPSTPPAAGARDYGRAWITAVIMTAAIMQIVDTTIVVVALPHMEGQLSASPACGHRNPVFPPAICGRCGA